MYLLNVENLTFSYGEKEILKNINISFQCFGLYIILGKSVSGKSTLLNLLQGSLTPCKDKNTFTNDIKPSISFQSTLLLDYL